MVPHVPISFVEFLALQADHARSLESASRAGDVSNDNDWRRPDDGGLHSNSRGVTHGTGASPSVSTSKPTSDTGQKSGGFTVKTSVASPSTGETAYDRDVYAEEGAGVVLSPAKEDDDDNSYEAVHTSGTSGRGHAKPVLLDLTGDGIQITELSTSQHFFDSGTDGLKNRIAWAAAGNAVLFYDPDNTGEITETRQVFFTEWDPTATSDLEALASVFDTNGDGVLDASDAAFADFKLMVTNADGSLEAKTLTEHGITSINLMGDATHIELPDGSVITGQTTFTRSDGTTGTVGDVQLSYESESYRVEQMSSTDGSGTRTTTSTGYNADGSIAFVMTSVASATGDQIDNAYDDNGDGVVDRLQSITTVTHTDGSETETISNRVGSDPATAILADRTVTDTSADGATVTISRDSTGGGWFDQVETRVTHADDSRTITVEARAFDGSVIQGTVETVSADGLSRTEDIDRDGDGVADMTITHVIVVNVDGSRSETVSRYNADGSLRSVSIETVSSDGRTKTISRDTDGDGAFETAEDLTITVAADGSTSSTIVVKNEDGSTRSTTTQSQSDDALTRTTLEDSDGDGATDHTRFDETVVHADGSRDQTVRVTNADGSIRLLTLETLGVIASDSHQRIDVAAPDQAIADDRAGGFQPARVYGPAGPTNSGALDDLRTLDEICQREEMWFHVDGCIGGLGSQPDLRTLAMV